MEKAHERINKLMEELCELRDELDSVDSNHYGRYTHILEQITDKQLELDALKNSIETLSRIRN